MGVFDKIKNALFEEEYVEVEEKPKTKVRPKKEKSKKEHKEAPNVHENKPIAKKVVLPERHEYHSEDMDDYVPEEEDFEIVPEREEKENTSEFKFPAVDDREFNNDSHYYSEPKIVEVVEKENVKIEEKPDSYHMKGDNEVYHNTNEHDLYHGKNDSELYHNKSDSNLYHGDYHSSISTHEYGAYEKKESKTGFKPSPIISPIYGILDKNYKKEEIVPKREVRLSSYTREHMSVDDVRRKAYGNLADDIAADIDGMNSDLEKKQEPRDEDNENLLVDLSSDDEKPRVSEVTMGDAEEYFRDLGLEYNIDYKDSSKEKVTGRRVTEDYDEKEKVVTANKSTPKEESETSVNPATDDNLFDLIDSMYEDEENKE